MDDCLVRHIEEELRNCTPILLIACDLFLPSGTLYGLDDWLTDLEKANIQPERQQKHLFMLYKGSS